MILTGWNTQRVGTGKKGSISRADSSAASVEGGDLGTPRSGADGTPGTPRESGGKSGEEKLSPGQNWLMIWHVSPMSNLTA